MKLKIKKTYVLYFLFFFFFLIFMKIGISRKLNFDETLALRSGWNYVNNIDAAPSFFMPLVYLEGLLTEIVHKPSVVFFLLRLFAVTTVSISLIWALWKPNKYVTMFNVTWCFLSGAFFAHSFEFRYDLAILVGWLLGLGILRRRLSPVWSGLILAWLLSHHMKGIFFGIGFAFIFTAELYYKSVFSALKTKHFSTFFSLNKNEHTKMFVFLRTAFLAKIFWIGIVLLLGKFEYFINTYQTFSQLAVDVPHQLLSKELLFRIQNDLGWWITTGFILLMFLFFNRDKKEFHITRDMKLGLAFGMVPTVFILFHPHPWPYMIVPIVPGIALFISNALLNLTQYKKKRFLYGMIPLFVLFVQNVDQVSYAFTANRTEQNQAMDLLITEIQTDDTVLDPTGLAYFMPSCVEQWYIDGLFQHLHSENTWMAELDISECDWILHTHRLNIIDPEYENLPRCEMNPVLSGNCSSSADRSERLRSYW